MVGIVIVSHSAELAEGVVALAREMAGTELSLQAAGGIGEPGVLGTDADRVRAAIEEAMSPDGVLVLMDLGSALMSAEFAVNSMLQYSSIPTPQEQRSHTNYLSLLTRPSRRSSCSWANTSAPSEIPGCR